MNLAELIKRLDLKVFAGQDELLRTISGGFVGDLLSDVIAHSRKNHLWVTFQVHPNIVAVAVLRELAGIVLVNGREPDPETTERAQRERVPIIGTSLSAFDLVGRLHELGIQGK
jgi:hypothetical protein